MKDYLIKIVNIVSILRLKLESQPENKPAPINPITMKTIAINHKNQNFR
jgi:hypothetical protein